MTGGSYLSGGALLKPEGKRVLEERRFGGGGGRTQKFAYQKWSEFPFVNDFLFSHYEIWVQGGGGTPPSPLRAADVECLTTQAQGCRATKSAQKALL